MESVSVFTELCKRSFILLLSGKKFTPLDVWINFYNTERTHSGKYCFGKTPMETFLDSKSIAMSKQLQLLKGSDNIAAISEAETGSAGEQPDRISLSSENEKEVEVLSTSFIY